MACPQNSSMGVCIFATFSTLDEFSSLFTRLNIAHDSYTFHETFIVSLHSFWNSVSSVSVHTDHWKEWPVFLLLCSTEERESCRFEMVWERVRQSVCRIVCCPSARISIQLLRGWFIMSHYSKVCKRFFTFPFFTFESDWLLLFSWNLKQGYYS